MIADTLGNLPEELLVLSQLPLLPLLEGLQLQLERSANILTSGQNGRKGRKTTCNYLTLVELNVTTSMLCGL